MQGMDSVERELPRHRTMRLMRTWGRAPALWYPALRIGNNQVVMDRKDPCNMPDVLLG